MTNLSRLPSFLPAAAAGLDGTSTHRAATANKLNFVRWHIHCSLHGSIVQSARDSFGNLDNPHASQKA
jgi:hypothetical protein